MDPAVEFPVIDGVDYVRVDGYFSSDTKERIPFSKEESYVYYVEHVHDSKKLCDKYAARTARSYYRKLCSGAHAILTSYNVVKKVKKNSGI